MYKNIIRGVINKKTGHALTIGPDVVYTYRYKDNSRSLTGSIGCWPDRPSSVRVVIKDYLQ